MPSPLAGLASLALLFTAAFGLFSLHSRYAAPEAEPLRLTSWIFSLISGAEYTDFSLLTTVTLKCGRTTSHDAHSSERRFQRRPKQYVFRQAGPPERGDVNIRPSMA